MVLEYEVADLPGPALNRIAAVLRARGVHEPLEGARQVNGWVALDATAGAVVAAVSGCDPPRTPSPRR